MERILIIDDEKPTLSMFRLFLSAYGFEVITAESGEEGIEAFKEHGPSIVLTDVKMPGMDGIEVLKRIKELDSRTEVIVITGHGDMDLAIRALNLDAADFINKPIQRQTLDQALQRARERMRIARDRERDVYAEIVDKAAVVVLRGNVSAQSESSIQQAFAEVLQAGKDTVLLRFHDNTSINGAGIAMLTEQLTACRERGLRLAATGLSDNFRKVFEVVGINGMISFHDSEDEVLQHA